MIRISPIIWIPNGSHDIEGKLQSKVISYPTSGFRVWSGSKTFSLSNAFSNKIEDNSKDEITKERIILCKKYYAIQDCIKKLVLQDKSSDFTVISFLIN